MIAAASGWTQIKAKVKRLFGLDLVIREWLDEVTEAKVMLT